MSRIRVKRVFITDRSYWLVYVGAAFVSVLIVKPREQDLRNLIGYKGWGKQFVIDSLKFLNEAAVEKLKNIKETNT